jgi:uracil phosphoribosyltransferase
LVANSIEVEEPFSTEENSSMSITVISNPLISHRLTLIRDQITPASSFRRGVSQIVQLMIPNVFADLRTKETSLQTPIASMTGINIDEDIVAIPVLRAGLGMLEPLVDMIDVLRISFLDMNRDPETLMPVVRRTWLSSALGSACIVILDPMLATGRTLSEATRLVKKEGACRIKTISLIAAPEGLECIEKEHPDVQVYVAAVDSGLDARGYIVPGLGDAGDRLTAFNLIYHGPNWVGMKAHLLLTDGWGDEPAVNIKQKVTRDELLSNLRMVRQGQQVLVLFTPQLTIGGRLPQRHPPIILQSGAIYWLGSAGDEFLAEFVLVGDFRHGLA